MQPRVYPPQTDFLKGLKNLINAAKRIGFPKLKQLQLHKHHLPNGVCKGFSVLMAHNCDNPFLQNYYLQQYNQIAALKNTPNAESWITNNADADTLLEDADEILRMQNIRATKPNAYPTDYKGLTHLNYEFAATVAINFGEADKDLTLLLQKHICKQTPNYKPDALLVSNGEHMISVSLIYTEHGVSYTVHDANDPSPFVTTSIAQLAAHINRRYQSFNRYYGNVISYSIAVLSHKEDPEFDDILKALKTAVLHMVDDHRPETATTLMKDKNPKHLLAELISRFEKGQSKVGFLNDLLIHYKRLSFSEQSKERIQLYLKSKPSMHEIYNQDFKHLANEPARNGYTWLHQAVMSNEYYFVLILLQIAKVDPNLKTRIHIRAEVPNQRDRLFAPSQDDVPSSTIIGPGGPTPELRDNEEVRILNTKFEWSSPLMFAALADNLEIFELLRSFGADINARTGDRPDGKRVQDLVAPESRVGRQIAPVVSEPTPEHYSPVLITRSSEAAAVPAELATRAITNEEAFIIERLKTVLFAKRPGP